MIRIANTGAAYHAIRSTLPEDVVKLGELYTERGWPKEHRICPLIILMAACTQIMITNAAFRALGGNPPHNTRKTGLFPPRLMKHDLDRLTAARGPRESDSDVSSGSSRWRHRTAAFQNDVGSTGFAPGRAVRYPRDANQLGAKTWKNWNGPEARVRAHSDSRTLARVKMANGYASSSLAATSKLKFPFNRVPTYSAK